MSLEAAQEWFDGRAIERINEPAMRRRVVAAVNQGLTLVATHLTDAPAAGSPERQEWEQKCDRCGTVVPRTEGNLSMRQAYPLRVRSRRITVLVTGMLCYPCGVQMGVDVKALPEQEAEPGAGYAAVDHLTRTFRGSAFGLVLGEQAEHLEHQVNVWEQTRGEG